MNSTGKPRVEVKNEGEKKDNVCKQQGKTPNKAQQTNTITSLKFKGETEELHGSLYNIGVYNQSNIFMTTTKKLVSYAGRHCCEPQDIRVVIEELEDTTFTIPTKRTTPGLDSSVANMLLSKNLDIYIKQESIYRQNKAAMFSVALGQCTEAMKAGLDSEDTYLNISETGDVVRLLKLIRGIAFDYKLKRYLPLAMYKSLYSFLLKLSKKSCV